MRFFALAAAALLAIASCTPVKDAHAVWTAAQADKELLGTWKDHENNLCAVTMQGEKEDRHLLLWTPGETPTALKALDLPDGQQLILCTKDPAQAQDTVFFLLQKDENSDRTLILKSLDGDAVKNAAKLGEFEGSDKDAGIPLTEKNLAYIARIAAAQPGLWKCSNIYRRQD